MTKKLKKNIIKFLKNWDNNTPDGYEFSLWDYCKIMDMTITLLRESVADEYKFKPKTFLESITNDRKSATTSN
jgi:hypothetical protein